MKEDNLSQNLDLGNEEEMGTNQKNEEANRKLEHSIPKQPTEQTLSGVPTKTNTSGMKRAHESSNSDKDQSSSSHAGILNNELQVIPAKANNKVWLKVTNKKGWRGKNGAMPIS